MHRFFLNKLFETVDTTDALARTESVHFGYSSWSFALLTLSNAALAMVLIILSAPFFLLIGLCIRLQDGGPVFYRGVRLGLFKRPFYMYKFRTLPIGTQKTLGAEQMAPTTKWIHPFSAFLRDSRLDELPQLFNIIRGDMDFIGPRPMRPEYYTEKASHIKNIDRRFSVRPGLIGYAQLLTPHGSPQRLRTLMDNMYIKRRRRYGQDYCLVFYTILILFRCIINKGTSLIWHKFIMSGLLGKTDEWRYGRVNTKDAYTCFEIQHSGPDALTCDSQLINIDDQYITMHSNRELSSGKSFNFVLEITVKKGARSKKKHAHCTGTVYRRQETKDALFKYQYTLIYYTHGPIHKYIIDQYFFKRSIA